MDVRVRFPLKRPINLDDHWPLASHGALLTFEQTDSEITALVVTLHDQPLENAPVLQAASGTGPGKIVIGGRAEDQARRLVGRFADYINLFFAIPIELGEFDVEYIPKNDEERDQIDLFSFKLNRNRPISRLPFNMLAQAFFASEGDADVSFISRMLSSAREAWVNEQYIEAFRFCFLLFEAMYGNGKFKTRDLIRTLASDSRFRSIVEQTLTDFRLDPLHAKSPGRDLAAAHPTVEALIEHLVDRRGYYFHGNLARADPWHPDQHGDAHALAEVCIDLAAGVAHSVADAMFVPEINRRFIENAKEQGAIMTIDVQFFYVNSDGKKLRGTSVIEAPGTVATSDFAVTVSKNFLHWAQTELNRERLVQVVGIDRASGQEIFRSQFLGGEQALSAETGKK